MLKTDEDERRSKRELQPTQVDTASNPGQNVGTLLGRSLKSPLRWIKVENIDFGSHDAHMEGSTIAYAVCRLLREFLLFGVSALTNEIIVQS